MFADWSTSSAIRVTVNNLMITDRKITVVKTELNRKIIVLEKVVFLVTTRITETHGQKKLTHFGGDV